MIAQEVAAAGLPELVAGSDSLYYSLDYEHLSPVLVEGIKQLAANDSTKSTIIDSLKQQLQKLQTNKIKQDSINTILQQQMLAMQTQIAQCCSNNSSDSNARKTGNNGASSFNNSQNLMLSSTALLFDPEPNPFSDYTTIRFILPSLSENDVAYIVVYDSYGREINKSEPLKSGYGSININSANLANGNYYYSLTLNNQILQTKKMIRIK